MQNIVSLRSDRPRPQRALAVPRDGARILFFTGVRYCRGEVEDGSRDAAHAVLHVPSRSERGLDAAAH